MSKLLFLLFVSTAAVALGDESKSSEAKAQDDEKTLEEALDEAIIRISESVDVVANEKSRSRLPGSAYRISGEDLGRQMQGFDDPHRVLRRIPGIVIQEEDGYGLRPNIGMRGSGVERSEKITLMEDGVLIAPAPYTAPSAYYFPISGRMSAFEVRKGSSQVKYGPRTNGGVLNLVSTQIPTQLGLNGNVAFGQDNTLKGHISAGDHYENVGWMVETYQIRTDGFKELDGGNSSGFYIQDYVGKLRLQSSPRSNIFQSLELKLQAGKGDEDETYLGLTDADFQATPLRRYAASQLDNMAWDHQQYQAQHFLAINDAVDITTTVYRNNFARNWYKLQSIAGTKISKIFGDADLLAIARGATSDVDALKIRANNREYFSQGVQSSLGFDIGQNQQIELGFRYHQDEEDRFQHEDGFQMVDGVMSMTKKADGGSKTNRVSNADAFAFFAQDQIDLGQLTVTPGFRYENINLTRLDYSTSDPSRSAPTKVRDTHITTFIPGVGMSYPIADAGVNIFGGVYKGFSPPGPGANEFTEPEQSINYEFGLRTTRADLPGIDLVVFYNDYSNLLGSDTLSSGGTGEGDLFNGGAARTMGIEAAIAHEIQTGSDLRFPFQLSYTFTQAEFLTNFDSKFGPWGDVQKGDELPYLPKHQLFASFQVEDDRWSAGIDAHYNGQMRTSAGQNAIEADSAVDAYFVIDFLGEVNLSDDIRAYASLQNLTNSVYIVSRRPAGVRPGLPRTLMMGLKLRVGR